MAIKQETSMAALETTRMNSSIRAGIRQRVINHRFASDYSAIVKMHAKMADDLYCHLLDANARGKIAKLPAGWMEERTGITAHLGFQSHQYNFSGKIYWRNLEGIWAFGKIGDTYRRIPNTYGINLPVSHEFSKEGERIEQRKKKFEEELRAALKQVDVILKSSNTIKTLRASWPEIEPFLPMTEEAVRVATPNLPAVSIPSLNAMLRLPVEKVDVPSANVISPVRFAK